MRRMIAGLLAMVQLQPVLGLVLCLALGPGVRTHAEGCTSEMSAGTGMQHAPVPQSHPGEFTLGATGKDAPSHGCPAADACTPLAIALLFIGAPPTTLRPVGPLATHFAGPAPDLVRSAPPTPPPNL